MAKRYLTPEEKREICGRRIETAIQAGIELFRFRASTMAAGPCPLAAALNEERVPIVNIELVPFAGCPHPDQCGCQWQAWLPLMDELGL